MEQPRRRRRIALIAVAAIVVAALGLRILRGFATGDVPERREPEVPQIVRGDEQLIAEVLNGTSRRGLARLVTRLLRRGGVDVVYFGTAGSAPAARTEILVRRGEDTMAAWRVARALGTGRVRLAPAPERRVDITVVLGQDYHPPATSRP